MITKDTILSTKAALEAQRDRLQGAVQSARQAEAMALKDLDYTLGALQALEVVLKLDDGQTELPLTNDKVGNP